MTVLKAFFDEDFIIPNPVETNASGGSLIAWSGAPLTVGGELNKLASNISIAHNWAGVHWRSDGIEGMNCGEQQAIGLLRDYSRTYNERFAGFTLRKFDGARIRIQNGTVFPQ